MGEAKYAKNEKVMDVKFMAIGLRLCVYKVKMYLS